MSEYEEEFPRADGPPPVANYDGRKIFKDTKTTYTVELDHGAFRMLWEMIEFEGRRKYPTRESMVSTGALLRAVSAFRSAWWSKNEKPTAKKPTGHIVPTKRARKSAGEAKAVRTVKKRQPVIEARPEVPARRVRRIRPR